MQARGGRLMRTIVVVVAILALLGAGGLTISTFRQGSISAVAQAAPQERNYTLYVREGWVTMPTGEQVWVYGYTDQSNGAPTVPGPTITANVGDKVNIKLVNDLDPTKTGLQILGDGHTIHMHGMDIDTANDGDWMSDLTQPVEPGFSFTYSFVAKEAGTYWYHCHQEALEHTQMGMYGALVIRPVGGVGAYDDGPAFDKEYTIVLSDMDSKLHQGMYEYYTNGAAYPDWRKFQANYFLMNGKSAPESMTDANTAISAKLGQKIFVRLINAGTMAYSLHLHGFHFQVVATDGRLLPKPYLKDTLPIAPGERYDILFTADQPGLYALQSSYHAQLATDGISNGGMMTMVEVADENGNVPPHGHHVRNKADMVEMIGDARSLLITLKQKAEAADWAGVKRQFKFVDARVEEAEDGIRTFFRNDYKVVQGNLDLLDAAVGRAALYPRPESKAEVLKAIKDLDDSLAAVSK